MTRSTMLPGVLLVLAALGFAASAPAAPARTSPPRVRVTPAPRFTPGEVVVVAEEGALDLAAGEPRSSHAEVARLLREHALHRARLLYPARPAEPARLTETRLRRVWVLSSDRPGFDPVGAARALRATGAVLAASPNHRFGLHFLPDDIYLFNQWYVDDGSFADVRLPFAWDVERGDSAVTIAILDTGVDTGHPDLAAKIWRNPAETDSNGVDDDGNGFIDDVEGWDFGVGDNNPDPEYTPDPSGIDVGFHGTFCAGIAAAATNNGEGIAGATWESRILPLKIAHPDSGLTSSAIAGAFLYALDQEASIISMSFGAFADSAAEVPAFFQSLTDLATAQGVLCVASAGNEGDSARVYPAAIPDVFAVGATDFSNARASFSNWGPWVDIAAPGSLMWSTICRNYTFSDLDQLFYILLFGWDGVNPYMYGDGTSFAGPLVAGVAALTLARYPGLDPALVRQHLRATGDAVAFDLPIGPKVNAFAAVNSIPTAVEIAPVAVRAPLRVTPNPFSGSGDVRFDLAARGESRVAVYDVSGRRVRTLARGPLEAGAHSVRWDGRDDRGARLAAGIYFVRLTAGPASHEAKVALLGR